MYAYGSNKPGGGGGEKKILLKRRRISGGFFGRNSLRGSFRVFSTGTIPRANLAKQFATTRYLPVLDNRRGQKLFGTTVEQYAVETITTGIQLRFDYKRGRHKIISVCRPDIKSNSCAVGMFGRRWSAGCRPVIYSAAGRTARSECARPQGPREPFRIEIRFSSTDSRRFDGWEFDRGDQFDRIIPYDTGEQTYSRR